MLFNNISPHKKYRLIVDTETTTANKKTIVYDIGYAIVDNTGKIFFSRHYAIYEIFILRPDLMRTAYYAEKIPLYWEKILAGKTSIQKFFTVRDEMRAVMKIFRIKEVGAANCAFDKRALNNTLAFLWGEEQPFFPSDTKYFCIWHMACQTICSKTSYLKFCAEYGFESEKGNVLTSAETVYRYLTGNPDYQEEHTGLEDVKIETEIFAACIRAHKKMNQGINSRCWMIPQGKYRKIKGEEA